MATGVTHPANGSVARPLRVFLVLTVIIAGLWVLDWSLEKTELTELRDEAHRTFLQGSRLLKEGKVEPAVDLLRRAHALERQNLDYELTLVDALMAAGKTAEAEPLLDEVLGRESNDGRANLIAARSMAARVRIAEAESYYHRAIYGEWPIQADSSRRAARMELVDFLIEHGRKEAVLAELLPLQGEAGYDEALQKRVAKLLLVAGSAQRAADAYRSLIERYPADADLYSGLGESELFLGQYRAAVSAFVGAFRHRPNDPAFRGRLEFASLMAALDPTPRQLSSTQKYRRSLHILEMTQADYGKCTSTPFEPPSGVKMPRNVTNELAEEKLTLAEELWRERIKACGESTSLEEEPLRLIMAKLAQ